MNRFLINSVKVNEKNEVFYLCIFWKNLKQPVEQTVVGARLELLKNVRGVVLKERVYIYRSLCRYMLLPFILKTCSWKLPPLLDLARATYWTHKVMQ